MKKVLAILLTMTLVLAMLSTCIVSAATEDLVVTMQIGNPIMTLNGTLMEIDPGRGTAPVAENGRTLIPIRALIERMGGTVNWNQSSQTVDLMYNGDIISLSLGGTTAYCNGVPTVLDVAPKAVNGRTIFPVRYIAESFKFAVDWDGTTQTITIGKMKDVTNADIDAAKTAVKGYIAGVCTLDTAVSLEHISPDSPLYEEVDGAMDGFSPEAILVAVGIAQKPTEKQKTELEKAFKGIFANISYELGEVRGEGFKLIVPYKIVTPDVSGINFNDDKLMLQVLKRMGYNGVEDLAAKTAAFTDAQKNNLMIDLIIEMFELLGEEDKLDFNTITGEVSVEKINGKWLITEDVQIAD